MPKDDKIVITPNGQGGEVQDSSTNVRKLSRDINRISNNGLLVKGQVTDTDNDIWNKRQITNIIGVGCGINYDVINTQEGKTKYLYDVDTKWFSNRPDICFYFKK